MNVFATFTLLIIKQKQKEFEAKMSDFCEMFPSECEPVDCDVDPLGDGCDIIEEDPDWDKINSE